MIKKLVCHFSLINKHRYNVFKLCIRAGIPFRGLVHDLSKYSPTEFLEGVKYYNGGYSPIHNCKEENGYSKAWLHHKGRNKHHHEYWYDFSAPDKNPIIPYKYTVEMICDNLAAGMTYQGKNWTKDYQLKYWNRVKNNIQINDKVADVLTEVLTEVSQKNINEVINSKNLKSIYYKHIK